MSSRVIVTYRLAFHSPSDPLYFTYARHTSQHVCNVLAVKLMISKTSCQTRTVSVEFPQQLLGLLPRGQFTLLKSPRSSTKVSNHFAVLTTQSQECVKTADHHSQSLFPAREKQALRGQEIYSRVSRLFCLHASASRSSYRAK